MSKEFLEILGQDPCLKAVHSRSLAVSVTTTTALPCAPFQDVVPQALLDQYLSMTDPSRAQTVDMEIAKHCAYSLPGVALTLGRQNWHCLRDTYETLASDMQVRMQSVSNH